MALSRSSILHYWSARYGPLPVIGGRPTHSRNSAAKVADARGEYYDAIINTPRFAWQSDRSTSQNERRATMRLEPGRTNSCLFSRDLSNAAWTTAGTTGSVGFTSVGLDGTPNSATGIVDNDATTFYGRSQTTAIANDSAMHIVRFWVSKDGGAASFPAFEVSVLGGTTKVHQYQLHKVNGTITLVAGTAAALARVIDDGLWWIVEIGITNNTTGNTTLKWLIYGAAGSVYGTNSAAATGGVIIGNVNVELNQSVGSSPIFTTSAAASRAADAFYWNFPVAPQGLMAYSRHVEQGTLQMASSRLWQIGAAADTGPRMMVLNSGGTYTVLYESSSIVNPAFSPSVAIGDTVEFVAILTPAAQVWIIASINGAAVSASSLTAGIAMPPAWSDTRLYLNSIGSVQVGANDFSDLRLVKYADVVASTAQGIMDELRSMEVGPNGDLL